MKRLLPLFSIFCLFIGTMVWCASSAVAQTGAKSGPSLQARFLSPTAGAQTRLEFTVDSSLLTEARVVQRVTATFRSRVDGSRIERETALNGASLLPSRSQGAVDIVLPEKAGEYEVTLDLKSPGGEKRILGSTSLTVQAAELNRIVVGISIDQVVGHPLQSEARVILLDAFNNLVTDYDLVANPILLVPDVGSLSPNLINNQSLLDTGVINLAAMNIRYLGPTSQVLIYATNGTIRSPRVTIGFNGYIIPAVTDFKGSPFSSIISGNPTRASVTVRNNGNLTANASPTVSAWLTSKPASVTSLQITPLAKGADSKFTMSIPTTGLTTGTDTVCIAVAANFDISTATFPTNDTAKIPVTVFPAVPLALVPTSFHPESTYAGVTFPVSFDVSSPGFTGPIDSAQLLLQLTDGPGQPVLATIFNGPVQHSSLTGSAVKYTNLAGMIPPQAGLASQWYDVKLSYRLASNGNLLTLDSLFPDSLFLVPSAEVAYVTGSLSPLSVPAGSERSFNFEVDLNSTTPHIIQNGSAQLTIAGSNFASTVSLVIANNTLQPGVNHISSQPIYVPVSLLGQNLTITATFGYKQQGAITPLTFTTNFNGQTIQVLEAPMVQIVEVVPVAPNAPFVNTDQQFQIAVRVANYAATPSGAITLRLTSDATDSASIFSPQFTIPSVAASDTELVYFSVTASKQVKPAEVFRVDIMSNGTGHLPPIDNIAVVTIQKPAQLAPSFTLLGAADGFVYSNEIFTLTVQLTNFGSAGISPGTYELSTGTVDFGIPNPSTGEISTSSPAFFSFRAPVEEQTATISFRITEPPVDRNSNLPAAITITEYQFTVRVISEQADLIVSTLSMYDKPLTLGDEQELFRLELANGGISSTADAQLDSITLRFVDPYGGIIDPTAILDVGQSGFFDADVAVATSEVRGDRIIYTFADFPLPKSTSRLIDYHAQVLGNAPDGFGIRIDTGAIDAHFTQGPLVDQLVRVRGEDSGDFLFAAGFATSSTDFGSSFRAETNPWNPADGPARFSYALEQPSDIELVILTLGGEEVLQRNLLEGSAGTLPGTHVFEWDGRNSDGKEVLNGVYIVQITQSSSGEHARLKMAVIK